MLLEQHRFASYSPQLTLQCSVYTCCATLLFPKHCTGTSTWSYNVSDNSTLYAVGHVTIEIPAAVPIATADAYSCPFNSSCVVNATSGVLVNDHSDNTGATLTVVTSATQQPSNGSVSLASDGSFVFTPQTWVLSDENVANHMHDDASASLSDPSTVSIFNTFV